MWIFIFIYELLYFHIFILCQNFQSPKLLSKKQKCKSLTLLKNVHIVCSLYPVSNIFIAPAGYLNFSPSAIIHIKGRNLSLFLLLPNHKNILQFVVVEEMIHLQAHIAMATITTLTGDWFLYKLIFKYYHIIYTHHKILFTF